MFQIISGRFPFPFPRGFYFKHLKIAKKILHFWRCIKSNILETDIHYSCLPFFLPNTIPWQWLGHCCFPRETQILCKNRVWRIFCLRTSRFLLWQSSFLEWRHTIIFQHVAHPLGTERWWVRCSVLDAWPKPRHIAKTLKFTRTTSIYSKSMGNAFVLNRCNSLPYLVRTSRQRLCNPRIGCRLCSIARIFEGDWSGD